MLGEEKRSLINVNLKKYPKQTQHPATDLKMELLLSQVLSSPLTTINQMFLTNNKRAISRFFGMVALNTLQRFYLFKVNNRNTKNTRA